MSGDWDETLCEWCGATAWGVTRRDDGHWSPSCGEPGCDDEGPFRGAR